MNNKSRKIILEYKTQIIVLLFSILALIVSILVIKDLIKIENGNVYVDKSKIFRKSEFSALIFLLAGLFFSYMAIFVISLTFELLTIKIHLFQIIFL